MKELIYNVRPTLQALRKGFAIENQINKVRRLPLKIKQNTSSKIRLSLTWNDISNDNLLEYSHVDEVFFKGKKIYLFKEPFEVPCFKQYYAKQVDSPDNWYLQELILGILFLNPNPDHLLKKKITERILQTFTECHKVESNVRAGEFVYEPILTFEEVSEHVEYLVNCNTAIKYYKPQHNETIMYGKSQLDKGGKIALRRAFKKEKAQAYYTPTITKTINTFIAKYPTVKISFEELEKLKIVKKFNTNEYATAKLIRNNLSQMHKNSIELQNEKAIFSTVIKKNKYQKFNLLDKPTLDEVVECCSVSRRDAMKFKKLKLLLPIKKSSLN